MGVTAATSVVCSAIARTSSSVSLSTRAACVGSFSSRNGSTRMYVAPTPCSSPAMKKFRPWTMETTATTAATPMMMPSVVRTLLILFAPSAFSATPKFSARTDPVRRGVGEVKDAGRALSGRGPRVSRERGAAVVRAVVPDPSVEQPHDTPRVSGDVLLVRDEHDRVPLRVEVVEEGHDLRARLGVEVAG